jgi:ribosomal protein L10
MTDFQGLSAQQLQEIKSQLRERYREFQSRYISLDMTRGKP